MGCALRELGNDVPSSILLILFYLLDILRIMRCTITNGLHTSTGVVYTFNWEMSIAFLFFQCYLDFFAQAGIPYLLCVDPTFAEVEQKALVVWFEQVQANH